MATWKYEVEIGTSHDYYMKDGYSITKTIRRISPANVSDIGLYSLGSSCRISSNQRMQVYANDVTLTFGGYVWCGPLPFNNNTADRSINVDGYDVSSSLLSVGTDGSSSVTIVVGHPGGGGNGCY